MNINIFSHVIWKKEREIQFFLKADFFVEGKLFRHVRELLRLDKLIPFWKTSFLFYVSFLKS